MKKLLTPKYTLAESLGSVQAFIQTRQIRSARIITEKAIWDAGLLSGVRDTLEGAGIIWDVRFAQDLTDQAENVPADAVIAAGGHGVLACVPQGAVCCHLPLVTADELSVMHLLAHGLETAIAPLSSRTDQTCAIEGAAMIIRALRTAPEEGLDEGGYQYVEAAALQIASCRRDLTGTAHVLAQVLGTTRVEGVSAYDALHGPAHAAATLMALPHVLRQSGDAALHRLALIAQKAALASSGAGDDVAFAALITFLRERCAGMNLPEKLTHIPRREVYGLSLAVEKAVRRRHAPVTPDRFLAEKLLLKLIREEDRAQDAPVVVRLQRAWFRQGHTLPLQMRRDALLRLRNAIQAREHDIHAALQADLGKCPEEAYLCETGMVLAELRHMLTHMASYARTAYVPTPLHQFPAVSFTLRRPFGVTLIMSPWNYPFLLTMDPLIGAIAAGNTCVIKPSAYAPRTSTLIREIVEGCFPQEHAAVLEGGREQNQSLLNQPFDKIFFTGGATVGKEVLRRAADHLTPVTLELGGKSPVVVDETANIPLAARRIAFGKLLNAGQTCVAPDYILAHRSVKNELIDCLKAEFTRMTGENALHSDAYPHLVNQKHYERVMGLIDQENVVYGGRGDLATLRIQPTIMDSVTPQHRVMQEEIFGPVLPILEVESLDEAIAFIRERPTPLACYLFSQDRRETKRFLQETPFGGGCVNDTIIHLASSHLPFGGMGASGMGQYHGRHSFDCFSHASGVVSKSTRVDLPMRYAPYKEQMMKLIRFFLK